MTSYDPPLDSADVLSWDEAEQRVGNAAGLLLGNGASRAIWDGFSYRSLYGAALKDVPFPLDEDDVALFTEFETRDFEHVLAMLLGARRVAEALGLATIDLRARYRSIQRALRDSVGRAHILWEQVPAQTLLSVRAAYRRYRSIYTTNYDLLAYWAIMAKRPTSAEFTDFFRGADLTFNPWTATGPPTATAVLFLHGALHLRRQSDGSTRKERSGEVANLLDAFTAPFTADETPLFVTEGASAEKERRIRSSDYLSFALDRLIADGSNLVILGQALGSQDAHISRAVSTNPHRTVAIGLHAPPGKISHRKLHYAQTVRADEIVFFASATHPITDTAHLVQR